MAVVVTVTLAKFTVGVGATIDETGAGPKRWIREAGSLAIVEENEASRQPRDRLLCSLLWPLLWG